MSDKDVSNKGHTSELARKSLTGFEALKPKTPIPADPKQNGSPSSTGSNKPKDK